VIRIGQIQFEGEWRQREDWVRTTNEIRQMGEEDEHQDESEKEKTEMALVD
jgi:hypothetical protein